ncbi:unnamed protein product, partial [Adineta steineri]
LVAIGWGVLSERTQSVPPLLQQVTIQAIAANSIYCQNVSIHHSYTQFCTGVMS